MIVEGSILHRFMRLFSLFLYYIILRYLPQYLPDGHEFRNIEANTANIYFEYVATI